MLFRNVWIVQHTGHNNKVLKELNVTPMSDEYMVFLFEKNVTFHQVIKMVLLGDRKNFLNRGCAVSVTSHYFILEYIVDHFPLYPVLDAVKHYTTWKDHLRILKASPNMYTNLRPMHSTVSCCHITLETTYTSSLLYEVTHSNNTFFHY